ncbi:hypothetical protein XaC1_167 [Xanthomonas phage XaC1]|nr:hypothetical protein XaC1_167 [Xanthomonas phage XaC1]
MQMFIPSIGTEIVLTKDWKFKLFFEHRNDSLVEYFKLTAPSGSRYIWDEYEEVTLPEGTEIKIDRLYIKKGNSCYDSVSVYAKIPGEKRKRRFWVKLHDFNTIICDVI